MGTMESRHASRTARREARTNGSRQMRQTAGNSREKAESATGRNQDRRSREATVSPTLSRLTTVARVSSPLLLKTTSRAQALHKPGLATGSKYNGLLRERATHPSTRCGPRPTNLGCDLARRLGFQRALGALMNLAKDRHVLPPEAVLAPHRTQKKQRQGPTFKPATFS